jgi:hypothetical protein
MFGFFHPSVSNAIDYDFGRALYFDGVNDYVTIPSSSTYNWPAYSSSTPNMSDFAMCGWVYIPYVNTTTWATGTAASRNIMGRYVDASNFWVVRMQRSSDTEIDLAFRASRTSLTVANITGGRTNKLQFNAWNFWGVRSTAGTTYIYVNGVETVHPTQSVREGLRILDLTLGAPITLSGKMGTSTLATWQEQYQDSIQVYTGTITKANFDSLYNSGRGASYLANCVSYWTCDGAPNTAYLGTAVVIDTGPEASHHGTPSGYTNGSKDFVNHHTRITGS